MRLQDKIIRNWVLGFRVQGLPELELETKTTVRLGPWTLDSGLGVCKLSL